MTHALRNSISPRLLLSVAIVLATLALALVFLTRPVAAETGRALAASHRGCSVHTLHGSYGGALSGVATSITHTSEQTGALILVTFNGNGTGTAKVTDMTVTNGPVSFTDAVTYTVNSDCLGTLTAVRPGHVAHLDIVVMDSGRTFCQLETDPGTTITGTFEHV